MLNQSSKVERLIETQFQDWGLIPYSDAYVQQKFLVDEVIKGRSQSLVFCEHPAVLTLGRMTKRENLLASEEERKSKGVEIVSIDRGGDVTLHAPGQLIVYPVFNLSNYGRDLHIFLHKLEQVAIDLLSDFDILASRFSGRTGVWIGSKKIVSMGIGVRKWVSYHGIGLNVSTDLDLFKLIRPCGLNVSMTSMIQECSKPFEIKDVKARMIFRFAKEFDLDLERIIV